MRNRYATYHQYDEGLRNLRRRAPVIQTWSDHEVSNSKSIFLEKNYIECTPTVRHYTYLPFWCMHSFHNLPMVKNRDRPVQKIIKKPAMQIAHLLRRKRMPLNAIEMKVMPRKDSMKLLKHSWNGCPFVVVQLPWE